MAFFVRTVLGRQVICTRHVSHQLASLLKPTLALADTCFDGECEGLHLSREEYKLHRNWQIPDNSQHKLIITAGNCHWCMFAHIVYRINACQTDWLASELT